MEEYMKELNIEQMEIIEGGNSSCSAADWISGSFGILGFGLGIAALLVTGPIAVAVIASQAAVFSGVASGVWGASKVAGC